MCCGQKKNKPKTVLWLLEFIWIIVMACSYTSVKLFKKKKKRFVKRNITKDTMS